MPVYFTYHPEVGLQAQVQAPTTRKARTTYLDYLYRHGLIPWRGRQDLKKSIIVDQIDEGELPVDIELRYRPGSPPGEVGEDQTESLDPTEFETEQEFDYMPRGKKKANQPQPQAQPQSTPQSGRTPTSGPYSSPRLSRSMISGKQTKAAQSMVPKVPGQGQSGRSKLARSMVPKGPRRGL